MTTTAGLTSSRQGETFLEGLRRRLALTGLAVVYVLLAVPTLAMLIALTVSLSTTLLAGVGLVLLPIFVPITQQLANLHRALSGWVLGHKIEHPYRPRRPGGPLAVLGGWANDPARWRDFIWTYAVVCIRWALAWIALFFGLAVIWYAIFPFLFAITPDGTFDTDYGIFTLDTQAESYLHWILMLVAFGLWWWLEPVLIKWCALFDRALLSPSRGTLERRVAEVSASRAESIDHSAAELRRIERDLHDGAQARLVSLGMSLGLAQELMAKDPEAAAKLLSEARTVTTSALGDLRSVVRGIHPPVLADRGLAGALQALALDMSLPVSVTIVLGGRPPAPVESAVFFATSELLANLGKHASATRASIDVSHDGDTLQVVVTDDGVGGASLANGTGLAGVARRLAAFDGTMDVVSPVGGPTMVTLEVPCALSSPKTSPSSGTA